MLTDLLEADYKALAEEFEDPDKLEKWLRRKGGKERTPDYALRSLPTAKSAQPRQTNKGERGNNWVATRGNPASFLVFFLLGTDASDLLYL